MVKNVIIGILIFIIILINFVNGLNETNLDIRIDLWKMGYERERAEVIRQQEVMISFGIPIVVIDPNNPLKVIPVEKK